jgi:hypothetical protein
MLFVGADNHRRFIGAENGLFGAVACELGYHNVH